MGILRNKDMKKFALLLCLLIFENSNAELNNETATQEKAKLSLIFPKAAVTDDDNEVPTIMQGRMNVTWKVAKPGNIIKCRIGIVRDGSPRSLKSDDGVEWFDCGTQEIEMREVNILSSLACERCLLALDWSNNVYVDRSQAVITVPEYDKNSQSAQQNDELAIMKKGQYMLPIAVGVIVILASSCFILCRNCEQSTSEDVNESTKKPSEEDEPLTEFRKPQRKPKGDEIVEENAANAEDAPANKMPENPDSFKANPVQMGRRRPHKDAPLYELSVQAEEYIQNPPEIIQQKAPRPKDKVYPEQLSEEIKETSSISPTKDIGLKGAKQSLKVGQKELVKDFKTVDAKGKAVWKNTHFIFVLDCSDTMKGARWQSTFDGYMNCIKHLEGVGNAKDTVVTAFSFSKAVSIFCKEKIPSKCSIDKALVPFTGGAREYKRALKYAAQIVNRFQQKDYLNCIILVLSGNGNYTSANSEELLKERAAGRKIAVYTISAACGDSDESDMIQLAKDLNGEHYRAEKPEDINSSMLSILGPQVSDLN